MVGLAGWAWAGAAWAEVHWHERKIVLEPAAGAADAKGEFVFVNRGTAPVRLVDSRSSCDCTVLARSDAVVFPGQTGRVPVVVHLEGKHGRQTVGVVVTTSEPDIRTHELTVEVEIKEFATLTPRLLSWRVGDEPTAKVMQLSLAEGFRFLAAESNSPSFRVAGSVQPGGLVRVVVTPQDTWARRSGELRLKVGREGQAPVEVTAALRIL